MLKLTASHGPGIYNVFIITPPTGAKAGIVTDTNLKKIQNSVNLISLAIFWHDKQVKDDRIKTMPLMTRWFRLADKYAATKKASVDRYS
jgi:hypothetical protein